MKPTSLDIFETSRGSALQQTACRTAKVTSHCARRDDNREKNDPGRAALRLRLINIRKSSNPLHLTWTTVDNSKKYHEVSSRSAVRCPAPGNSEQMRRAAPGALQPIEQAWNRRLLPWCTRLEVTPDIIYIQDIHGIILAAGMIGASNLIHHIGVGAGGRTANQATVVSVKRDIVLGLHVLNQNHAPVLWWLMHHFGVPSNERARDVASHGASRDLQALLPRWCRLGKPVQKAPFLPAAYSHVLRCSPRDRAGHHGLDKCVYG
ncbi:hypothetical protein V5799_020137 [Amblyomma americanum]|uniref:Uncharacterized protein n=1 Tax=Amblyomma americanum TaxID=6943 RepID=A0AAQ4EVN0_AMBAM